MSRIYATTERAARAVETDKAVLYINPFLWSSFESSCNSNNSNIDPHKLFDVERLKNFTQCFGVNPILSYANNEPSAGMCPTAPHQNHIPNAYQNKRHGSTTSTPILPSAIPPNLTDQITNKPQGNMKPPTSTVNNPALAITNDNTYQHSAMTTMITPVNQMLFESTLGTNTRNDTNDSYFTG